jgi:hypothetical protein
MKTSFELAAIDVDGTLLNSAYQLVDSAGEAMQLASQAGLMVCLVSGRPRCGILEFLSSLQISNPDITSGGAHVYDPRHDRVILDKVIPSGAVKEVILKARRSGVAIFAEAPYQIHFEASADILDQTPSVGRDYMIHSQDLLKVRSLQPRKITLIGEAPTLSELELELRDLGLPISLTTSGPRFLEINRENVDKGLALRSLVDYLQIDLERTLAIGDNHNDVSMFKTAGCSIAMGNAPDEVKNIVDLVAPSNDDDGVLWAMQKLLQGSSPFKHWTADAGNPGGQR